MLEGGICGYLQQVILRLSERRAYNYSGSYPGGVGGMPDVSDFVANYDPNMWLLASAASDCDSNGEQVAHISEYPAVMEERLAARALADDGETSDELAFLVDQRCCLAPAAASSMPYIS